MTDLFFKPIEVGDLDLLASRFKDSDTRRWVEPPSMDWFHYVHDGLKGRAWLVYDAGQPVGTIQCDLEPDKTCSFSLVTNPALRRRGYGKRMCQVLIEMQDPATVSQLVGAVEPENTASIRCLLSAGFQQENSTPDPEGFLHFSYRLHGSEG